ncbi:TPA: hypothetical protein ACH3X1_002138 [Trebouxia sp. C0004]
MRRAQANGVALPMLCAQPKQRHSAGSSTSFSFRSHEMALRKRDAALMLLSNDRRDAWQLSGLPLLPNVPVTKHTTAVQKLMVEVLSYTAQEHVFLCKDDYRQGPGALKPKGKAGCATRCVAFDVSAAQLAQSVSGHSDGKVTVHHFLKVLSTDDCNIMLNAPAGYGKTHLVKSRVWPALKKRYKAKGLMMASPTGTTALALGPGANTIHSLAGWERPWFSREDDCD